MKKVLSALLPLFLCAALLFSGCAAGSKYAMDEGWAVGSGVDSASTAPEWPAEDGVFMANTEEGYVPELDGENGGLSGLLDYAQPAQAGDKIIYTAWATVETLEFDSSVQAVYDLLGQYDAFLESASVTGVNYARQFYGGSACRDASFTIRVPKENFSALLEGLSAIGNVIDSSSQAENITSQYTDTESRLTMYRTEETRLISMLEQAASVEDMILIESRLSEVRYNIESLTTQLNAWQKQVDYSTLYLSLYEVERLTKETPVQRSYWQQVGDSLEDVLQGMGDFFKDFLRLFIAALPVLLVLAVVAGVVLVIVFSARRARKKRRARQADKTEES